MRKLILQLAVSLDGYIEGPNGEYDWCFTDQDYGMSEFFSRIDSVFYGRKSYEMMESAAPPEAGADFPALPKLKEYVFSKTLDKVRPGAVLISGDIQKEVNRIKNEPGKDIWLFGGASLTSSMLEFHLVDEISLAVHPIILGSGKPLFTGIHDRMPVNLIESKPYSSGLVMLTYSVKLLNQ